MTAPAPGGISPAGANGLRTREFDRRVANVVTALGVVVILAFAALVAISFWYASF